MGYGIRVVLVMNRKGGSGKSTLCRALASAAAARGETVTIFDTDSSRSCLKWMQAGQQAGNWPTMDFPNPDPARRPDPAAERGGAAVREMKRPDRMRREGADAAHRSGIRSRRRPPEATLG
jgi:energy-coupling factor transporter ATP-binding protein EcfA2